MGGPVQYQIDLSGRDRHLVEISVTVPADLASGGRLFLPTWTPGSYVMRDYVHHLQTITARDTEGAELELTLDGHTGWVLPTGLDGPVTVTYELYANQLTVRTNHVDDHHALLVGAATFVLVEGGRDRPHEVTVEAQTGSVWSLLPFRGGVYVADDADHLVDAAFEIGDFPSVTAQVNDRPHHFVWAGHGGEPDLDRVAGDMTKIAEVSCDLFDGDLPIDEYTFLCVGWDAGGGGLEHRDGSVLMMPVTTFQDPDGYARFQSLMAHEYLHLWNVKRLLPTELVRPDLVGHTHTRLLWVAEGWTAYYDELLPLRAGIWTLDRFLKTAGKQFDAVLDRPGARFQSVEEASYHAWTKQYVRDENSLNTGVDYYGHGALLAWSLDLLIRRERPDGRGLDDAMRSLWRQFGRTGEGYTSSDVVAAVNEAAGQDLSAFFERHVRGRELPPLEELVDIVGLQVSRPSPEAGDVPWLGITFNESDDATTVTAVLRDGPAWSAGLTGGDVLVAIEQQSVQRGQLEGMLRRYQPGNTIEITINRGPRVVTRHVQLGQPRNPRKLAAVDDPTPQQAAAFQSWTGQLHPGVADGAPGQAASD